MSTPVDLEAVERRITTVTVTLRSGHRGGDHLFAFRHDLEEAARLLEDQSAEIRRLREALAHMQMCRVCAEGPWADCAGGRAAEAALGLRPQEEVLP